MKKYIKKIIGKAGVVTTVIALLVFATSLIAAPSANAAPTERSVQFCEDQFTGAQVDLCKDGASGDTCAQLEANTPDARACQSGAASGMCDQPGAVNTAKTDQELDCYWDVQKCFDQAASSNSALRECSAKARNIQADSLDGYFNERDSGDAGVCGEARTNIITCEGEGVSAMANVLKTAIFILTILIGIVAVGGITYGAILYASAEDNAGQTTKAKGIIRDVAIGLLLYGLMVAIINWLIPGGVIG